MLRNLGTLIATVDSSLRSKVFEEGYHSLTSAIQADYKLS